MKPTPEDIRLGKMAARLDYWCRDCQDWFRSEQTPVHAPATPCPKCKGANTYAAYTESGFD